MMNRARLLEILKRHVTDEIVVSSYSSAFDWFAQGERTLNYFSHGAMGLGSSHGLGLALARPERRVIVLDGDGSLLMNLGTLVTNAEVAPKNLFHFVCENGTYEANGGVDIPGRHRVDFAAIARAAGYREAYAFSALDDFRAQLPALLRAKGPVFATLKIEPGELSKKDYDYIHGPEPREAFRAAVAQR